MDGGALGHLPWCKSRPSVLAALSSMPSALAPLTFVCWWVTELFGDLVLPVQAHPLVAPPLHSVRSTVARATHKHSRELSAKVCKSNSQAQLEVVGESVLEQFTNTAGSCK